MNSILGTILVGLIVGVIARFLMPGRDPMGWIVTILLGIAGSFLASYGGAALGLYPQGSSVGWIASIIGAMVLLLIYNLVSGKSRV